MAKQNLNQNFKVISWNANGLNSHLEELLQFLEISNILPDFLCIQETWIYDNILPQIPGYNSIHTFRINKQGGGSAIYIKDDINYYSIENINFTDVDIEVSGLIFQKNKYENVALVSVYIAPNQSITQEHLNKLCIYQNQIIVGDFNAKHNLWGSPLNDGRGKIVEIFLEENNFVCLNKGEETRINYNGSISHLDLAFCTKNMSFNIDCIVLDDNLGSDHFPLELSISFSTDKLEMNPNIKFNYRKADWLLFSSILTNDISFENPINDIDEYYTNFVSSILAARDKCVPQKIGMFRHKYSPFWNQDCSNAKLAKKVAEKALRKNKNVEYQINYKKSKANFKEVLNKAKKNYWESYCANLNYKSKSAIIWNKIKDMKGKSTLSKISIKNIDGTFKEDSELAQNFADIFSSISLSSNIDSNIINSRTATVNSSINSKGSIKYSIPSDPSIIADRNAINEPFQLNELDNALKCVNTKSSPGYDEITYQLLKNIPLNVKLCLLNIINYSWINNNIPELWKLAIVKPIVKANKDKNDLNSYRPISLTCTCSKIMEKMIFERLSWYLEKNNLLNQNQSGFRKKMSTSDPIIRLQHEASFAVESGNITVAILIDFTRAFDLLWVDGLLLKMMKLHIKGNLLNWIKNFLTNRKYIVKINNMFSAGYSTENGTPQGSIISPLLFLIMLTDFPTLSNQTSDAFFADDSTIWRSGTNLPQILFHLQQDLNLIDVWCKKWGLMMNSNKTVGIIFTKKQINPNSARLQIQGNNINFCNSVKLLGIFFDSRLTWKTHIDFLVKKSINSLNLMRSVSGTGWGANKNSLLTLYKSLILSSLDYCSFAFSECSTSLSHKLDTIQYKALLISTGAMKGTSLKALLGECAELPLDLRRKKLTLSYLVKIDQDKRNLASSILEDKKFHQLELKCKSTYKSLLFKFREDNNIVMNHYPTNYKVTPWYDLSEFVNLSYLEIAKNSVLTPSSIDEILLNLRNQFDCLFFVDGSVGANLKVGAAIYSPSLFLNLKYKLPGDLTIYYAEAFAILKALNYAQDIGLESFCIISDSSRVLNDIKNASFNTSPHSDIIYKICDISQSFPSAHKSLTWLPSHCGNSHIDIVDHLAKSSSNSLQTTNIDQTRDEAVLVVNNWIWSIWKKQWENKTTNQYQNTFNLQQKTLQFNIAWKDSCIVNRLRMLQSRLNAGLHKVGRHDTGLCSTCNTLQTEKHFLLDCIETIELRKDIKSIYDISKPFDFQHLLSDKGVIGKILQYVHANNILI